MARDSGFVPPVVTHYGLDLTPPRKDPAGAVPLSRHRADRFLPYVILSRIGNFTQDRASRGKPGAGKTMAGESAREYQDYNQLVALLYRQRQAIAELSQENRELRRKLHDLRRGIGINVTIHGQTMALASPVVTVVNEATLPPGRGVTGTRSPDWPSLNTPRVPNQRSMGGYQTADDPGQDPA